MQAGLVTKKYRVLAAGLLIMAQLTPKDNPNNIVSDNPIEETYDFIIGEAGSREGRWAGSPTYAGRLVPSPKGAGVLRKLVKVVALSLVEISARRALCMGLRRQRGRKLGT